ncbi:MAG: glycosyltransferase [Verrucomicrobiota bacterium]|jgi:glycosyltransferase involved in cell wall biosynthesis
MSQPVVTVCVPVYSTVRYIRQCIESVFAPEFTDWILLVSDNCSTDGTWEFFQQLHHPQMRLYRQPRNPGASVIMHPNAQVPTSLWPHLVF